MQVSICSSVRPCPFVRPFIHPSTFTLGVLWAQLLLQFCTDLFETSNVFHHGMRMCMWFGYNCEVIFCYFFHFVNLVIFWPQMNRQWVPCERNSSYNFIPIFLKLCTCFLHGQKMCMWFGYNPCFNFCHFFHFANFVISWPQIQCKCIDSWYLGSATPHTILYPSFWNFAHIFAMVWKCACGLNIILELIFVPFSILWTLSFSDLRFYESV